MAGSRSLCVHALTGSQNSSVEIGVCQNLRQTRPRVPEPDLVGNFWQLLRHCWEFPGTANFSRGVLLSERGQRGWKLSDTWFRWCGDGGGRNWMSFNLLVSIARRTKQRKHWPWAVQSGIFFSASAQQPAPREELLGSYVKCWILLLMK